MSEGTAYRAIKDASQLGIVATIDRVGTVRIEKRNRENLDNLTFNEIANIVEGQILAGRAGLNKSVSKFAIGAMQFDDILKYIGKHTLLIVGNRENVQIEALKRKLQYSSQVVFVQVLKLYDMQMSMNCQLFLQVMIHS